MDNQHREIAGYRELNATEILLINNIKAVGSEFETVFAVFEAHPDIDKRWLAIAKTDLQKGLMALVRSVAKPDGF